MWQETFDHKRNFPFALLIQLIQFIFCHQSNSTIYQKKRKKRTIGYLNFYTGFVGTKVNTLTHTWIKFLTAFV